MSNKVIFTIIALVIIGAVGVMVYMDSNAPDEASQASLNIVLPGNNNPEVSPQNNPEQPSASAPVASTGSISFTEVGRHGTKTDCWTVLNGKVYDLTKLITSHSQSEKIVQGCGVDASKIFKINQVSLGDISSHYVGDLK